MAFAIKLHRRFTKRVNEVYHYLIDEWGEQQAQAFIVALQMKLKVVSINPLVGSLSDTLKGVRTISITKHSRLFYKVYARHIAILYLKDTRERRYRR